MRFRVDLSTSTNDPWTDALESVRRQEEIEEQREREMFVCPKPFQWFPEMGYLPNTRWWYVYPNHLIVYDPYAHVRPGDWIVQTEKGYRLVKHKDDE